MRSLRASALRNTMQQRDTHSKDDGMPETTNQPRGKVRLGVVGGGPGSNIGETHRYAARLDDRYALVTGVFTSDAERSRGYAATLDIAADRRYGIWQEMADQEGRRVDGLDVGG